ncbi:TIGR04295 family B12-binding domain-containing radical SAM protein [Nitrosococcus wardiae]|uniref:TIGR04295 family B12-binding domain-containing radical SAM protein n=1 Tax=Nitrosococcus wardiae TaxID=1814290 RepID=A0A4P7C4G2_9GAMM|nr:TIGR04295 family B12-binding domain-containing radical SAM protein [Nitrosococcus wardiae]QBQ55742.1 TIGR04295 family B12-binding domain-containing radical SAM protein [Nitrosococcus wardiae]
MRYALINPIWTFEGSIYFGCRDPHLPLELGYAKQMLEGAGHEVLLLDATLDHLSQSELCARVATFGPDMTVIPTAPSYLFWRCPPPELRVPQQLVQALGAAAGIRILVGPHASTTPRAALRKVGGDIAVLGECEEVLVQLGSHLSRLQEVSGIAYLHDEQWRVQGGPQMVNLASLPALHWPQHFLSAHRHHHHRFDEPQQGFGAEIEASRGCPYACSFCAKTDHRDQFRRRPLDTLLEELDGLISQGVRYVYFIDEIFLPQRPLLQALKQRPVQFGIQTRIDLWKPEMLDLLGESGCVSVEAGVESLSERGRDLLNKHCRLKTVQLQERLIYARRNIPFVQASLLDSQVDDHAQVEEWRQTLLAHGVWANKPVPMFPYPGSPDYIKLWGVPDDLAWERAVDYYLQMFSEFSDIQEELPRPLEHLELGAAAAS